MIATRAGRKLFATAKRAFRLTTTDRDGFRRVGHVVSPKLSRAVTHHTGLVVHPEARCYAETAGSRPWHRDAVRRPGYEFKLVLFLDGAAKGGEYEFRVDQSYETVRPAKGVAMLYDVDAAHQVHRIDRGESRYVVMDVATAVEQAEAAAACAQDDDDLEPCVAHQSA